MTDVQFGSVEAISTAASYTDATGGLVDYDGGSYAQLTAKASGAGASIGWKLRAIVAGVLTTLLTFTAGSANAVFAGNVSAQAVTATSLVVTSPGASSVAATVNSGWALTVSNAGTTGAHGLYVNLGASSDGTPFRVDKNGAQLFAIANGGAATIAAGLTVAAGGIDVTGTTGSSINDKLTITRSSGPPLQLNYDSSNNITLLVSSAGVCTYTVAGSAPAHVFAATSEWGRMIGGALLWGTTVGASVAAGDVVVDNGSAIRSVVSGGADTQRLIWMDGANFIQIGGDGPPALPRFGSTVFGGTAAAAKGVTFAANDLAGTLVLYDGVTGARYKFVGTAF